MTQTINVNLKHGFPLPTLIKVIMFVNHDGYLIGPMQHWVADFLSR